MISLDKTATACHFKWEILTPFHRARSVVQDRFWTDGFFLKDVFVCGSGCGSVLLDLHIGRRQKDRGRERGWLASTRTQPQWYTLPTKPSGCFRWCLLSLWFGTKFASNFCVQYALTEGNFSVGNQRASFAERGYSSFLIQLHEPIKHLKNV